MANAPQWQAYARGGLDARVHRVRFGRWSTAVLASMSGVAVALVALQTAAPDLARLVGDRPLLSGHLGWLYNPMDATNADLVALAAVGAVGVVAATVQVWVVRLRKGDNAIPAAAVAQIGAGVTQTLMTHALVMDGTGQAATIGAITLVEILVLGMLTHPFRGSHTAV